MFATMPPAGLIEIHNDPKEPMPGAHRPPAARRRCPTSAIAALVGAAGPGSGSPLISVELRHLGGALPIDAAFSLFAVGSPIDAQSAMAIDAALARLMTATAPFDAGRSLLELHRQAEHSAAVRRLHRQPAARDQDRVDGGDLFAANHAIR